MKEKVINTIKKNNLIQNGDKLVLAVSGGPDSLAMLNLLLDIKKDKKIEFDFVVAHVNHMIRKEAIDDENFVKDFCEKNNIKFFVKRVDIPKLAEEKKMGTEEAGRYARYEFFDEVMKETDSNKISIAHNKNDKIETILMNLLRGSGVSGLKGIEYIKDGKYIRPLLDCTRLEIEEYCANQNLSPRIDKTNFDNTYTRNKVRNVVIPYVQREFNPNIIDTLSRLSDLVKEEEMYVQKQVEKVYNEMLIKQSKDMQENMKQKKISQDIKELVKDKKYIVLKLKLFNMQERVIKSKVLLYTITRLLGNSQGIEKIHIDDIIKLCERNIGNKYLTPNKNLKIFLKNGQIYFIDQR